MTEAPPRSKPFPWTMVLGVAGVAALAAFGMLVMKSQELPQGVVDVAWDKTVCSHCRMHVGDPHFAAQVQQQDGQVFNFDDPGCMLTWLDGKHGPVHAAYVHHHTQDRWLPLKDAAFVEVTPTPMGFGLGAVSPGEPGALPLEQARLRMGHGHMGGMK